MVIKIITLHSIYNPGSALQAYALQAFLASKGHEVQIIDYRPWYSAVGKNKLKGCIRNIVYFPTNKKLRGKFGAFMCEHMALTDTSYKNEEEIRKNPPAADVYVAGSDQLWNMDYDCGRDDAYYLTFVKSGRKIAYATSIGKKEIPEEEVQTICSKIKDYEFLSVREKSNALLLEKKLGRPVRWVCDPVFLLPADNYEKMIKRPCIEKYAVVYLSAQSRLLDKIVEDIKKRTDYKVILLGGNVKRCKCDDHIKALGPYDFLSYIRYAELVVSSSFHATAFCHIFHKRFGVLLPPRNEERIISLLGLSKLEKHVIHSEQDIGVLYEQIDFTEADGKLKSFIDDSKQDLQNALAGGSACSDHGNN